MTTRLLTTPLRCKDEQVASLVIPSTSSLVTLPICLERRQVEVQHIFAMTCLLSQNTACWFGCSCSAEGVGRPQDEVQNITASQQLLPATFMHGGQYMVHCMSTPEQDRGSSKQHCRTRHEASMAGSNVPPSVTCTNSTPAL